MEQWYRMNKAANFTEFYKALSMASLPMFNIVYADRYDTIFYISNAKLPIRNPDPFYNWESILPGNTSATLWTRFKSVKVLPQYINPGSGYLYNTNHSPSWQQIKNLTSIRNILIRMTGLNYLIITAAIGLQN